MRSLWTPQAARNGVAGRRRTSLRPRWQRTSSERVSVRAQSRSLTRLSDSPGLSLRLGGVAVPERVREPAPLVLDVGPSAAALELPVGAHEHAHVDGLAALPAVLEDVQEPCAAIETELLGEHEGAVAEDVVLRLD